MPSTPCRTARTASGGKEAGLELPTVGTGSVQEPRVIPTGTGSPLHLNKFHSESVRANTFICKFNKASLGTQLPQLTVLDCMIIGL